jgi:AP-3 complex subunit beta
MLVLKYLVQTQLAKSTSQAAGPQSPVSIISHLASKFDDIQHPQARACVLWLVGQYAASDVPSSGPEGVAEWAPDVLRKAVKTFAQEDVLVKLQTVALATKLFVLSPNDYILMLLSQYTFSLARYDTNYDVRDRGRMLASLLAGISPSFADATAEEDRGGVVLRREQVKLVLFEGKAAAVDDDEPGKSVVRITDAVSQTLFVEDANVLLGSLDAITGKPMHGDRILPDWLERGVESALRDTEEDKVQQPVTMVPTAISSSDQQRGFSSVPIVLAPGGSSTAGSGALAKAAWKDLDSFYAEEEEESEDDEDDEDGDGTDQDSEDEESSGEEDDSSEDNESSRHTEGERNART